MSPFRLAQEGGPGAADVHVAWTILHIRSLPQGLQSLFRSLSSYGLKRCDTSGQNVTLVNEVGDFLLISKYE